MIMVVTVHVVVPVRMMVAVRMGMVVDVVAAGSRAAHLRCACRV